MLLSLQWNVICYCGMILKIVKAALPTVTPQPAISFMSDTFVSIITVSLL